MAKKIWFETPIAKAQPDAENPGFFVAIIYGSDGVDFEARARSPKKAMAFVLRDYAEHLHREANKEDSNEKA